MTQTHDEITEANIEELVHTFYAKVCEDDLIGPIFNETIVGDWGPHLVTMVDFWSSVMLMSGAYKGNPQIKHRQLASLKAEYFPRWLALFEETADELFSPELAAAFVGKAQRISESLKANALQDNHSRKTIDMTPRTEMPAETSAEFIHHTPTDISDRVAYGFVKMLRFFADAFFAKRYGHRAIVLETVAAVPGMVGGMLQHLRALRRMQDDRGWIKTLLDEAENERMHLMTFIEIAKPTALERLVVLIVQAGFFNAFFLLYLLAPKTAHRVVGYFEEEAVRSYTSYLAEIDAGRHENVAAPQIAIDYWDMASDARLRDVVLAVREDEAEHRDVNHGFADTLAHEGKPLSPIKRTHQRAAIEC